MPLELKSLTSFVPSLILRQLVDSQPSFDISRQNVFEGVAICIDISGFTQLTEQFAEKGPKGVEELSNALNTYFGSVIDLICAHGGEVMTFAGDAVIAVWPPSENDSPHSASEFLWNSFGRSIQGALSVQKTFHDFSLSPHLQLKMRIGIGYGRILLATLCSHTGRCRFFVAGEALDHAFLAKTQSAPGEVVVCPDLCRMAWSFMSGQALSHGFFRVDVLNRSLAPQKIPDVTLPSGWVKELQKFLPLSILPRLEAEQKEWLAEFRWVTVIFVWINGVDYGAAGVLNQIQEVLEPIHGVLDQYEGTVNQFLIEDKGTILLAAFGLPSFTHEDDPVRAIQVAWAIKKILHQQQLNCAFGITTGRAFCGEIGNDLRKEYTMIGETINLAARLMQIGVVKEDGHILCDEETFQRAHHRVQFQNLPAVQVKGKIHPIQAYHPQHQFQGEKSLQPLVGREREKGILQAGLRDVQKGKGGIIVIEGEPGVGKTRLVADLLEYARQHSILALQGMANALEQSFPYHGWRSVFFEYFGLKESMDQKTVQSKVMEELRANAEMLRLSPLLNAVLPLGIPENEWTGQMHGKVRADNTQELLIRLLSRISPFVLVLEDIHWLDSASWEVVKAINVREHAILMVLSTRGIFSQRSISSNEFLSKGNYYHLNLESLSREDVERLICHQLGVSEVPSLLLEIIWNRAQGNPFFSEELLHAIREKQLLVCEDGKCRLLKETDLQTSDFPTSVQGVIASRIDRLSPQQEFTLKLGSVIGRTFQYRLLMDIHPIPEDIVHLSFYLTGLAEQGFVYLESPDPDLTYSFKHVLTREVAYNLLLSNQQRVIHRKIGEWYEEHKSDNLESFYSLLSYHWVQAEVPDKAIKYLYKSGEQALEGGAYQDAIQSFTHALSFIETQKQEGVMVLENFQHSQLERELGEAHLGLGNHVEGQIHLEKALDLLGTPLRHKGIQLLFSLIKQVVVQIICRLTPLKVLHNSQSSESYLMEHVRAHIRLVETFWFANNPFPLLLAGIKALNCAERATPSAELAKSYAIMCIATGSIPFHSLAEMYGTKAVKVAQNLNQQAPLAYANFITSVYRIGVGAWETIRDPLHQSADIFQSLGDRRLRGDALTVIAMMHLYQGKFVISLKLFSEVQVLGWQHKNIQHEIWGRLGKAECLFRLGDREQAIEELENALALLQHHADAAEILRTHGLMATIQIRCQHSDRAEHHANAAIHLIQQLSHPTSHYLLEGYAGPAEAFLTLWQNTIGQPAGRKKKYKKQAKKACAALRKFSTVFPIGRPRALLCSAWENRLEGRVHRSTILSEKSLAEAQRLAMQYEEGLAHAALGRYGQIDMATRHKHLSKASEIFNAVQAKKDLAVVQEILRAI